MKQLVKQLVVQFSRAHKSCALADAWRFATLRIVVNWLSLVVVFPFVVAMFADRSEANAGNILERLFADCTVPSVVMPRDANRQVP